MQAAMTFEFDRHEDEMKKISNNKSLVKIEQKDK